MSTGQNDAFHAWAAGGDRNRNQNDALGDALTNELAEMASASSWLAGLLDEQEVEVHARAELLLEVAAVNKRLSSWIERHDRRGQ